MSIVLITGDGGAVGPLVAQLKQTSINVLVNYPPGAEDVVVFCVTGDDGTPPPEDAYSVCRGISIGRWAVLVEDENITTGNETARWIEQRAGRSLSIPVLTHCQPDLPQRLREISRSPPQRAVFGNGEKCTEIDDAG